MVLFNYSTKELTAKIVYYGPGLCGKTTNLQWIHDKVPIKNKGKMLSLSTETDRTLFFDFLPIELGTIRGMKTRIQLYTVPGQVFYNATRRMVLKGADSVVFVCDTQEPMLEANLESMENLRQNLEANEINPDEIPMVLQYNKRDLTNALPIEILNERLNPRNFPFYEAVAIKGIGVEETLKGMTALVFRSLSAKYGSAEAAASAASPGTAPPIAEPTPAFSGRTEPRPPSAPPARLPSRPAAAPRVPSQPAVPRAAPAPPPTTLPPASQSPISFEEVAEPSEDILDSLELLPSADALDAIQDVDLGLDDSEPVIEVDINEDQTTPPPLPGGRNAGNTLISPPREVEELRRKIRSATPDSSVEVISVDADEIEQEVPPQFAAPGKRTPVEAAPPFSAPVASGGGLAAAVPAAVHVPQTGGPTEVTIPLEVTVERGTTQVHLQLRLTINLKLK